MHTVVLLQGKCKSINVYGSLSLATSPLRYTHTMFVFPPYFSLGIFMTLWTFFGNLWQPLATCLQGEAMYIGGLWEGISPKKKTRFFSLATSPPKGSHIYTYTHTMFVFPPSFSLGIFITFWTFFGNLWQPLRKSDNLCGSLAIPSQVYEQKGSNMM